MNLLPIFSRRCRPIDKKFNYNPTPFFLDQSNPNLICDEYREPTPPMKGVQDTPLYIPCEEYTWVSHLMCKEYRVPHTSYVRSTDEPTPLLWRVQITPYLPWEKYRVPHHSYLRSTEYRTPSMSGVLYSCLLHSVPYVRNSEYPTPHRHTSTEYLPHNSQVRSTV